MVDLWHIQANPIFITVHLQSEYTKGSCFRYPLPVMAIEMVHLFAFLPSSIHETRHTLCKGFVRYISNAKS